MAVSFAVDDVLPAREPPTTVTLEAAYSSAATLGCERTIQVLALHNVHPLLGAVHHAFAEHRPLILSPDAIWLTIAQGLALHMRLHRESVRERLGRPRGTDTVAVKWDGPLPEEPSQVALLLQKLQGALTEQVGPEQTQLFLCDFSTTGLAERLASAVVMLDAYSPFYDYALLCICGIPEISLQGSPEDWRSIRARIEALDGLGLECWTPSLRTIADKLVQAAEGHADRDFFRRIYKPREQYAAHAITGWIGRLFPYVGAKGRYDQRNPMLDVPIDTALLDDAPSITSDMVPAGLSSCHLRVVDPLAGANAHVAVEGGLLGVEAVGVSLQVRAGWLMKVGVQATGALLDEVAAELWAHHRCSPPQPLPDSLRELPAELSGLYSEVGDATLFAGPREWRLRPVSMHELVVFGDRGWVVRRCLDLPDGSFVAFGIKFSDWYFVRLRGGTFEPSDLIRNSVRTDEDPREIPVLATSLLELLQRALRTGGDLEFPSRGTVAELILPAARTRPKRSLLGAVWAWLAGR